MGYNLHMASRNVDEHWKYAEEEWILIEHTDNTTRGFPELPEADSKNLVKTFAETRINSPGYEKNMRNSTNIDLDEPFPDNSIEYIYYLYLMENNNGAFIEEIPLTETVETKNLLAGPFSFLHECQNFLLDYSTINNIKLQQKSEFEFSFVN